ncbi:gp38 [Listeria phage P40]|uniref:nucleotide kinase n=1 Tax=Listeria phage P40 TaxID=560178 RepID=UPI00018198F3|nr:nucleotide kinase [Listeria phage P40]ACI00398.1 gp38 [Listeria phage P40]
MSKFKKGDHLVPTAMSGLDMEVIIFEEISKKGIESFLDSLGRFHHSPSWKKLEFTRGDRLILRDADDSVIDNCTFFWTHVGKDYFLDNDGIKHKVEDWCHDPSYKINLDPNHPQYSDIPTTINKDGNILTTSKVKTEFDVPPLDLPTFNLTSDDFKVNLKIDGVPAPEWKIAPPNTYIDGKLVTSNKSKASDTVNNPAHYTQGKIECIDYIYDKELNFSLGSAVKYITRAGHKEGSTKEEDLRKAIKFLEFELNKGCN